MRESIRPITAIFAALFSVTPSTESQENVAMVPALELRAGGDSKKQYYLIGQTTVVPESGFRLLLVLPGGDGSAAFHPFVKRIHQSALGEKFLLAQLVAPQWSLDSQRIVWPTKTLPDPKMTFPT